MSSHVTDTYPKGINIYASQFSPYTEPSISHPTSPRPVNSTQPSLRIHYVTNRSPNGIFKPVDKLNLHVSTISSHVPHNYSQAFRDPN